MQQQQMQQQQEAMQMQQQQAQMQQEIDMKKHEEDIAVKREKIQADIIAGTLEDPYLSLLNTYIKPCLIHAAMLEALPYLAYTIGNKGIYKHGSENAETVSKEEVDYMIERERKTYQHYKERFIDYICQNNSLFPEYTSNSGSDVYPNTYNDFSGWVI